MSLISISRSLDSNIYRVCGDSYGMTNTTQKLVIQMILDE